MQETLYNGIVLPHDFPPRNIDLFSPDPLPVPYLTAPPQVIDISVGRQLFVDGFLIERMTGLYPYCHHAVKYEGNPIFTPQTPAECNATLPCACPKSGGVWFDRYTGKLRMWYEAGWLNRMALAESTDGLHWTRPELDVEPGTNLLLPGAVADSSAVFIDYDTKDPAARYKLFLRSPGGEMPAIVSASPDGIHWNEIRTTSPLEDRSTVFYNPFRKKWVYSIRRCIGDTPSWRKHRIGRVRYYRECDNLLAGAEWTPEEEVPWLRADCLDASAPDPAQLYNFDAVGYESILLGLFQIHNGPTNKICDKGGFPKRTELIPAYSRDGFHFSRPDRTPLIAASGEVAEWDRGYVQSVGGVCLIRGDELWFYYIGFEGDEGRNQPSGKLGGMHDHASTGIAKLRRDGFVSLDGTGEVLTRPLRVSPGRNRFFLNAKAPHGAVRVELTNADGTPLPGFSAEDCTPFTGNSTAVRIRWNGSDPTDLPPVFRIRFRLRNAQLYSFWLSDTDRGDSHGPDAAGNIPIIP